MVPPFITRLQMDELACFAPGMLALGASGYGPEESKVFMSLAEEVKMLISHIMEILLFACLLGVICHLEFDNLTSSQLAWTCYNFYQSTPTKLAGENYFFNSDQVSGIPVLCCKLNIIPC